MKRWITAFAAVVMVAFGSLAVTGPALAASEPDDILDNATSILNQFVNIPESSIPPSLLNQAYGIAVIPSVLKAGFIAGAQYGKGVLSVRTKDGKWSNPTFVKLYGGSFGFQIGASSTDLILVFKTRRSVERLADGEIKLGADASIAAGPVGRRAGAATNLRLGAEVYSYSRSRGLFAGVALNGAWLSIDNDENWLYYNQLGLKASTLLNRSSTANLPQPAQRFVYTLNRYMPGTGDQFHYGTSVDGANTSAQDRAGTGSAPASGYTGAGSQYNGDGGVTVQQLDGATDKAEKAGRDAARNAKDAAENAANQAGQAVDRATDEAGDAAGLNSQPGSSDYSGSYGSKSYGSGD